MRRDFDARFAAAERRAYRFARVVGAAAMLVWLLALSALGLGLYLIATTSPEEFGAFFGRIVSGFTGAAR